MPAMITNKRLEEIVTGGPAGFRSNETETYHMAKDLLACRKRLKVLEGGPRRSAVVQPTKFCSVCGPYEGTLCWCANGWGR